MPHEMTPDEIAQLLLDHAASKERLERVRCLIERRDDLDLKVRELMAALKEARRKKREAEWDLNALLSFERRVLRRPEAANGDQQKGRKK